MAERGEGRGRVVLAASCSAPIAGSAVGAAIDLARAFDADIEALLIEDRQRAELGAYAFAREIALTGVATDPLPVESAREAMRLAARDAERRFTQRAHQAGIGISCRTVGETPMRAIQQACQSMGPWNVVVLSQASSSTTLAMAGRVLDRVTGMTGVMVPFSSHSASSHSAPGRPVIAFVEDAERMAGMIRAAERLARPHGGDVVVALWSRRASEQMDLSRAANAAVVGTRNSVVELARPGADVRVVADALRRLAPHTVIAAYGGIAAPAGDIRAPLGDVLNAPVLLVR